MMKQSGALIIKVGLGALARAGRPRPAPEAPGSVQSNHA